MERRPTGEGKLMGKTEENWPHTLCGCNKSFELYVVQFPRKRLMRVDVPHLFDRLQCLTMGNKTYVQYIFDILVMMCSRKMILITIVKVKKLSSLIEISVKSLTSILQIFVKVVVTTPFILCAVGFLEFLFCSAGLQSSNSIWSSLWKSIEICDALVFDRSPHNFVGNHLTILSCKEVLNSRLNLSSGI